MGEKEKDTGDERTRERERKRGGGQGGPAGSGVQRETLQMLAETDATEAVVLHLQH